MWKVDHGPTGWEIYHVDSCSANNRRMNTLNPDCSGGADDTAVIGCKQPVARNQDDSPVCIGPESLRKVNLAAMRMGVVNYF